MFHSQSEEGRTSVKKKGCQWLYTTHDEAHYDAAVSTGQEKKVFKSMHFLFSCTGIFSIHHECLHDKSLISPKYIKSFCLTLPF